eukprot:TRINITY_DN91550_c0_g1_i1.p1 TRINITY_DN91550_c0_g1~~TRINITY_DN91550_c0_g1_i1.p1  ORF type:complete len:288 (-),score=58.62 TRINITY_DN91550_c0_g1_i1:84-947(-)
MGTALCTHHDEEFIPFRDTGGEIRMLIVALDYDYTTQNLTCTNDAKTIFRMADRASVENIVVVTDKAGPNTSGFPTREVCLRRLREMAGLCNPGDWFIWFYAGHGINVPDHNSDEHGRGLDQAFVTPDKTGTLKAEALLVDDEFAHALDNWIPEGVRILCINDCCHSGSICDIDTYDYKHEIYQLSAAQDDEEADDIGGGVLTISLRRTVKRLSLRGKDEFTMWEVMEKTKDIAATLSKTQEIELQWHGTHPQNVAWPLSYPWWEYVRNPLFNADIYAYEKGDSDAD